MSGVSEARAAQLAERERIVSRLRELAEKKYRRAAKCRENFQSEEYHAYLAEGDALNEAASLIRSGPC